MTNALFAIGLSAAIALTIMSALKYVKPTFEFWPPPSASSWQHSTFRALFRVFFFTLIVLSIMDFQPGNPGRYVVGGTLLLVGFGLALRWTGFLGWENAFGEATGLKTKGPFSYSRNPIYMVSILGMLGWAILINSWLLTVLLAIWACLYIAAPLLEEPWMRQNYGQEFSDYEQFVPRYGSLSLLELKVPPLAIVLLSAGAMYWLAETIRHTEMFPIAMRISLAVMFGVIAAVVLAAALLAFRKQQTTMNPLDPEQSTNVVSSGIYRYSRNPMYLAMFSALLGWTFYLGQASAILGLVFYYIVITRLQISPEERILTDKFGEKYTDYTQWVSRWIGLTSNATN